MNISSIPFEKMIECSGSIINLRNNEEIHEITLSFDSDSKKKLREIIVKKMVNRNNQDLFVKDLLLNNDDALKLIEWQEQFVRTENSAYETSEVMSTPHYSAKLKTIVSVDGLNEKLIEIFLGNFQLNLNIIPPIIDDDSDIVFENVDMTVFYANNSAQIIE